MLAHSVLLLASGQVPGPAVQGESQSIYQYCLQMHLRYLKAAGRAPDTVFVCQADYLQLESGKIEGIEVRFISTRELFMLTADGNGAAVLQVSPVERRRGQLLFQVTDFAVARQGQVYSSFKGCRSTFGLRLNCETNLFEVELKSQRKVLSF